MMAGRTAIVISSDSDTGSRTKTIKYMTEEDVLRSVSKGVDPDDWPCFVIKDAVVYKQGSTTMANLLHAELDGPFMIRGKLEVERSLRHLCLISKPNGINIEVNNVRGFSMGVGPVTIWACGISGWLEIQPSSVYKATFKKIAEGIELYYFLIDLYEAIQNSKSTQKSQKTLGIDQISDEYLKQFGGRPSRQQFETLCRKQAPFLISQMRKEGEPIEWKYTFFYNWLLDTFPEVIERYDNLPKEVRQKVVKPTKPAVKKVSQEPEQPSKLVHSKPRTRLLEIPVARSRGNRTTRGIGILPKQTTTLILQTIEELQISGRLNSQNLTLQMLSRAIYKIFDIPTAYMAQEILKIHAQPLLAALGVDWATSTIYKALEEVLSRPRRLPGEVQNIAMEIVLQRRHDDSHEITEPIEQQVITLAAFSGPSEPPTRRVGRPSQSTQTTRARRQNSSKDGEMDFSKDSFGEGRRSPRRSGKVAGLRPGGMAAKQRQPTLSPSDTESRKKRKLSPLAYDNEEWGIETHVDEGAIISNDDDTPMTVSGEYSREESAESRVQLKVTYEPLMLVSPNGPDGVWTCHSEGCNHTIKGANELERKSKVRAHFLEHADEIVAREKLVLDESRPHLPINNLLEKIRSLGESARLGNQKEIGGKPVPQRIKRPLET